MSTNPYESPGKQSANIPLRSGSWVSFVFKFIVGFCVLGLVIALLLPTRRNAREAGRRAQCLNNVKQIGLALLNYEQRYHAFPPAYTVDANGNRLHSWRTFILPQLDRNDLFKKVDFSKPWNDPANREVYEATMEIYQCPKIELPAGHTTYMVVVAPDGIFRGAAGRTVNEITDGPAMTLVVAEVEAARHVHWMSPADTDLDWLLSLDKIEELPHNGVNAVFADGRAKHLDPTTDKEQLRAMVSIAGGDDEVAIDSD